MGIFTIKNFIKSYIYHRNMDKRNEDNTIDEQIELQIVNYSNFYFLSNELKVLLKKNNCMGIRQIFSSYRFLNMNKPRIPHLF